MKYIIYVRKSSEREDHQILSIESQIKVLKELAIKKNFDVVCVYKEEKSAYKTGRPKFNEMLAKIEAGKADGIIVYHLTRIARNSFDGGRVIYMMDQGLLKEIITPETSYTNISDHKFMMQIHFAMAKKSSDDTSTFVKRDNQAKLEKGELIGLAPPGYLNIDKEGRIAGKKYTNEKQMLLANLERPLKRTEIDPIEGPLYREMLEKAAERLMTITEILKYAHSLGLKNLKHTTLASLLRKPTYYGYIRIKGELYRGDFEPLISKDTFDKIQTLISNKSKPRKQVHSFSYTGLMRCGECGSMITAERQKGHVYYRCSKKKGKCSQPYIRGEILEEQFVDHIRKVQIPDEFVAWALKQLKASYKDESKLQENIRLREQQDLNRLKKKQSRLLEEYLSGDSILTKGEYLEQKQKVIEEINNLEISIESHSSTEVKWIGDCETFFEFANKLLFKFNLSGDEEKKFIIRSIGSNFTLFNRELTLEYQKLYQPLLKLNEFETKNRLEPRKAGVEAKKNAFAEKMNKWGE